jgi:hypothetical protein
MELCGIVSFSVPVILALAMYGVAFLPGMYSFGVCAPIHDESSVVTACLHDHGNRKKQIAIVSFPCFCILSYSLLFIHSSHSQCLIYRMKRNGSCMVRSPKAWSTFPCPFLSRSIGLYPHRGVRPWRNLRIKSNGGSAHCCRPVFHGLSLKVPIWCGAIYAGNSDEQT